MVNDFRKLMEAFESTISEDDYYPPKHQPAEPFDVDETSLSQLQQNLIENLGDEIQGREMYLANLEYCPQSETYRGFLKAYPPDRGYLELYFYVDTGGGYPYPTDITFDRPDNWYPTTVRHLGGFNDQEEYQPSS